MSDKKKIGFNKKPMTAEEINQTYSNIGALIGHKLVLIDGALAGIEQAEKEIENHKLEMKELSKEAARLKNLADKKAEVPTEGVPSPVSEELPEVPLAASNNDLAVAQ